MTTPAIIHLASGNDHKVQEFQRLADAAGLAWRIVPANPMPEVEEDTGTFAGNARKKAQALQALLPADAWVLADDSGVCVEVSTVRPGWSRPIMPARSTTVRRTSACLRK